MHKKSGFHLYLTEETEQRLTQELGIVNARLGTSMTLAEYITTKIKTPPFRHAYILAKHPSPN